MSVFLIYIKTIKNVRPLNPQDISMIQQLELMQKFSEIAREYEIFLETCAEAIDLENLNLSHSHCIDRERLERLGRANYPLKRIQTSVLNAVVFPALILVRITPVRMDACIATLTLAQE